MITSPPHEYSLSKIMSKDYDHLQGWSSQFKCQKTTIDKNLMMSNNNMMAIKTVANCKKSIMYAGSYPPLW